MGKQLSDIVRDKLIVVRKKDEDTITLTDSEACNLWSQLTLVEAEVSLLKSVEFEALKKRFARIEKYLKLAKSKIQRSK